MTTPTVIFTKEKKLLDPKVVLVAEDAPLENN